jgi:hypothetical protein
LCESKKKKQWLPTPSWFYPPFWSFGKKLLLQYFFYWMFYPNPTSFNWFAWRPSWICSPFCFFAPIYFFYFFLIIWTIKICHWINSKLKRDRKNPHNKWWNMIFKKTLICEGPNPSSISELIVNESKNPNLSLILI